MANNLSSLVFKLLMLSSCMLVRGQNCSISGTMRYLYMIVCGFQRSLDWTTGMDYSIVVQLKIQFTPACYRSLSNMTSCGPCLMQVIWIQLHLNITQSCEASLCWIDSSAPARKPQSSPEWVYDASSWAVNQTNCISMHSYVIFD